VDERYVELTWNAWVHAIERHPHMSGSLTDIVLTIEHPEHREPDLHPGRERLFRRGGPDKWIRVIVEFCGSFDRMVTAFSQAADPRPGRRR
jgi:hypothetical protein